MEWEVAVGQIIERNWNNNNNNNNSYFCRYRVINGKGKSKEIEKSRVGLFSSFRKGHNKHKEALSLSLNADGSDHFISKQNKTEQNRVVDKQSPSHGFILSLSLYIYNNIPIQIFLCLALQGSSPWSTRCIMTYSFFFLGNSHHIKYWENF